MAFGYIGHILWRDRNESFLPEDPLVVDNDLGPEVKFTFIDVIPGVLKKPPAGFPAKRESFAYHSFSSLIGASNDWLNKNTDWEVINCETVLLFFKFEDNGWQLAPQDTCFHLDGDAHSTLMALRLWLRRREIEPNSETESEQGDEGQTKVKAQVLCYADFKPQKDDQDDTTRFEKLETVIDKANQSIRDGGIAGSVITVETLYFPANSDWEIDTEATLHVFPGKCVSIFRIFYESGPVCREEVGIKDFSPKLLSGGGLFKKPSFESLSGCILRASDWLASNSELDFKNAQCLEIKVKSFSHIETNSMSHSSDRGDYLRIFRVAYTKPRKTSQLSPNMNDSEANELEEPRTQSIFLSSVIFTPADCDASVQQIKRKLHDWVEKATRDVRFDDGNPGLQRPRLLSAETVEIFCRDFSVEDIKSETENTFQYNRIGTINCFLFMAFRIYFDVGQVGRAFRSRSIASTASRTKHDGSCKMM